MAIVGSPVYNPDGQFSFIRAYVPQVSFGFGENALFSQSANEFYVTDGNNPDVHVVINWFEKFWLWSSNGYTIDHLIVDSWIQLDSAPGVKFPLNFNLYYNYDAPQHRPEFFYYVTGWTHKYRFALPAQPPGYWLPPYL